LFYQYSIRRRVAEADVPDVSIVSVAAKSFCNYAVILTGLIAMLPE